MIRISHLNGFAKKTTAHGKEVVQRILAPALARNFVFRIAFIACLLGVFYWWILASDRYVSEAHVVLKRLDVAGSQMQVPDLGALITGSAGGNKSEQLLLRDHLLSVDMMKKLDAQLDLKSHYSSWRRDPFSRLWFTSQEWFHRYYHSRVSVELDDYSGVLVVSVQAYDPEMAHSIGTMMVREGEQFMNAMAHRTARQQVDFLEREVAQMSERTLKARQAVLAFQNRNGLISPQSTAESLTGIVNNLEAKLTELKTRRTAMLGYLSPSAPAIVDVNLQISALERQISDEKNRLASPASKTLNQTIEEFQRLAMTAELAQDLYKTSLIALEKGRIDAIRTINMVSVLQEPTRPEYPMEPKRLYNSVIVIIVVSLLAGIIYLLGAIIRDHKD